MALPIVSDLKLRAPNGPGPFAPGQQPQPPTDLNSFLTGMGAAGLNDAGQPVGSTGGLLPMQRSQRDQLASFTNPSQMPYNGGVVNPLQKLNDLLGIQSQPQGMRVPQSQFALPQGTGPGPQTMAPGAPSSTPMVGMGAPAATSPTQISAFGEQVRTQGPQTRNGATFSATDTGFSITQDPSTVPQPGQGQVGLPQFLQGVNPQTIAPVINAMGAGGDPEQIRAALLAGAPAPEGLSQEQQAAWTLEQAALGQQSAALYDQMRRSGMPMGSYGTGMLTNAMNQSLGQNQGGIPGLTPVQSINTQVQAQQEALRQAEIAKKMPKPVKTADQIQLEEVRKQEALGRSNESMEYNRNLLNAADAAETGIRDIDRSLALIDGGAKTGFAGEWMLRAKQLGAAMGMEVEGVKEGEELRTLFGNFVMNRVGQTKGAISNKEMELFKEYSPNLNNTTAGNKAILAYARQAYERLPKIARLVRELRDQGVLESEIEKRVEEFREANPLNATAIEQAARGPQTNSGLTGKAREDRKAELREIIRKRQQGNANGGSR